MIDKSITPARGLLTRITKIGSSLIVSILPCFLSGRVMTQGSSQNLCEQLQNQLLENHKLEDKRVVTKVLGSSILVKLL